MKPVPVEIAVQDAAGVRIALDAGAARVELCQALALGGLTPSHALIARAVRLADAAQRRGFVHVLIRPRAGGFVYDEDELSVALEDVRLAVRAGASGVVVGALREDRTLDLDVLARFVDAADGADVTVHRCVDAAADPLAAVAALTGLGVRRVLTSGGAARSLDGIEVLRAMTRVVDGGVEVMAGGGVRPADIAALADAGVDAVHLSARGSTSRGGAAGPGGGVEDAVDETDGVLVAEAIAAASA